jgi:hypothetical protein
VKGRNLWSLAFTRPKGTTICVKVLRPVLNESVVDCDLVSRLHGTAVTRQALSIRNVAADSVPALRRSVVWRHSYPDTGDARTFRDLPLRLVHQAGPYPLPPEARQHVEVLDLRDACSPKGRVVRGPYNCYVPGEDRTNPSLLLRKVARNTQAGLVPSEATEDCRDRDHVATFERAYRGVLHLGGAGHMAGRSRPDGWLCRRR